MSGVMRAAAELSLTGVNVWFPWRFAIFAKSSRLCVYSKLAKSSMRVVVERSGPGLIAVVGANTALCLCMAVFL